MSHKESDTMNTVESDSDDDSVVGFANLDLTGVDFDRDAATELSASDKFALEVEHAFLSNLTIENLTESESEASSMSRLRKLFKQLGAGEYIDILKGDSADRLFSFDEKNPTATVFESLQQKLFQAQDVSELVEFEFVAIAALNLYLQMNYTGPKIERTEKDNPFDGIDPHPCFQEQLQVVTEDAEAKQKSLTATRDTKYHNTVLSELAVEGIWPCQVADVPYFLLVARCVIGSLSQPETAMECIKIGKTEADTKVPGSYIELARHLKAVHVWNTRSIVTHERLLLSREPTQSLWNEIEPVLDTCVKIYSEKASANPNDALLSTILLEYGLAQHHFNRPGMGKPKFQEAIAAAGLKVEVTGAAGKRTKYQQNATAQMIVTATSSQISKAKDQTLEDPKTAAEKDHIKSQEIQHSEDTILLDRVALEKEEYNEITPLTILDQSILLALCLDVKNNNPADGLTGEEMTAYLARVLCHHDDWMVYSTGLLERAWLEFERNHTKERAILQLQALCDQHTNRLTITQSTKESIEQSSPVQDRLKNLHSIVYPPRWHMLRDVAERYAALGIVTSAAEQFAEIEYWDEVVICYQRAGKEKKAEEIVRERLEISETPRMWAALGDITNDPEHYETAAKLSKGRFAHAYSALGKYYFEKGDIVKASENYRVSVELRPLSPAIWFRLGTISMQLEDWDQALTSFTQVVQQEPEEAEAWANVAAVHMRNKNPTEAYPALVEVSSMLFLV